MSFEAERKLVESHFKLSWQGSAPVKYENVEFKEPTNQTWVALFINPGMGFQASLNPSPTHRIPGVIIVQVFTPKDTGTAQARKLADTAADIFRRLVLTDPAAGKLVCRTPTLRPVGVEQGWYQMNVVIPYYRDVIYS